MEAEERKKHFVTQANKRRTGVVMGGNKGSAATSSRTRTSFTRAGAAMAQRGSDIIKRGSVLITNASRKEIMEKNREVSWLRSMSNMTRRASSQLRSGGNDTESVDLSHLQQTVSGNRQSSKPGMSKEQSKLEEDIKTLETVRWNA